MIIKFYNQAFLKIYFISILFIQFGIGVSFSQTVTGRVIIPIEGYIGSESFEIYENDTFNLKDHNGLIQGKGIWILKDSTYGGRMSSYSGYGSSGGCVYSEDPGWVKYYLKEAFFGNFKDNLRTGNWVCYWKTGEKRIEVSFKKNKLDGPIKYFYETGEVMYSGFIKPENDLIELKRFNRFGEQTDAINWFVRFLSELYF